MGLGTELLNEVKKSHNHLQLSVYIKNRTAFRFYRKNNFAVQTRDLDRDTKGFEYQMTWHQKK
ncbi:hypothetical protein WR164_02570 [Philodulcilactobacillus myokoensis]|uniref:Uncharacterized protein n=1 Tax=Philodulcilactobacillus myokoensis TaxID=2929573 RepID=A0A9W6B083_9LACO|nr:hypothetical protein WR164_02570 [Philodulcilactobacillus myokoensis]